MTAAKIFKYRTNLSRKMSAPGGIATAEALAKAQVGLDSHREAAMATLEEGIATLEAAYEARSPSTETAIYEGAAAVLDMAGFFDTGPLYRAAFSLCELSDRMIEKGTWSWAAVAVHVQALRLIFSDDCRQTQEADILLQGLASVLDLYAPS